MTSRGRSTELGARTQPTVFLERQNYRHRRLMDATRLLPILGVLLFLLPLLWPASNSERGGVAMSSAIIYLFSAWLALIVAILVFVKGMRAWSRTDDGQEIG